jgi:hypothetical protein
MRNVNDLSITEDGEYTEIELKAKTCSSGKYKNGVFTPNDYDEDETNPSPSKRQKNE